MRKPLVASLLGLSLAVSLVALLVACGGPKKSTGKVAAPKYTVTATDKSDDELALDIPSSMKGGVIILELQNDTETTQDFQLAKATSGHTVQELEEAVTSEDGVVESWMEFVGGVGSTEPGRASRVTLNLPPGDYWWVSTESQATTGASGELTLTGESGAEMPTAAATLVATDYSFTSSGFTVGTNTMSFRNGGRQFHHAIIVPMAPGATIDDVKTALLSDEQQGPPPIDFEKAVLTPVINPGQVIVMELELQAATKYAVLCFVPDTGTSEPPHAAKGMLVELTIA